MKNKKNLIPIDAPMQPHERPFPKLTKEEFAEMAADVKKHIAPVKPKRKRK